MVPAAFTCLCIVYGCFQSWRTVTDTWCGPESPNYSLSGPSRKHLPIPALKHPAHRCVVHSYLLEPHELGTQDVERVMRLPSATLRLPQALRPEGLGALCIWKMPGNSYSTLFSKQCPGFSSPTIPDALQHSGIITAWCRCQQRTPPLHMCARVGTKGGGKADKWTMWHLDRYNHSQKINMRIPKSYKNEIYFSLICCFKPLRRWVSVLEQGKHSGHWTHHYFHIVVENQSHWHTFKVKPKKQSVLLGYWGRASPESRGSLTISWLD
jgi:hypothetical protein